MFTPLHLAKFLTTIAILLFSTGCMMSFERAEVEVDRALNVVGSGSMMLISDELFETETKDDAKIWSQMFKECSGLGISTTSPDVSGMSPSKKVYLSAKSGKLSSAEVGEIWRRCQQSDSMFWTLNKRNGWLVNKYELELAAYVVLRTYDPPRVFLDVSTIPKQLTVTLPGDITWKAESENGALSTSGVMITESTIRLRFSPNNRVLKDIVGQISVSCPKVWDGYLTRCETKNNRKLFKSKITLRFLAIEYKYGLPELLSFVGVIAGSGIFVGFVAWSVRRVRTVVKMGS